MKHRVLCTSFPSVLTLWYFQGNQARDREGFSESYEGYGATHCQGGVFLFARFDDA
jgi:hypothetical protein